MATRREMLDQKDEIMELFYDNYLPVSKIADELNLREKSVSGPTMVEVGSKVTREGWLSTDLQGGDVTEFLAFKVLEFDSWGEYRSKYNVLRDKQRRESGFTEKKKGFVRNRDGNKCVLCLSEDNLHVHHKDGDATNNDVSNLVTLCRRCHNRVHSLQNPHSDISKKDFVSELVATGQDGGVVGAVLSEVCKND